LDGFDYFPPFSSLGGIFRRLVHRVEMVDFSFIWVLDGFYYFPPFSSFGGNFRRLVHRVEMT
jgi:hypothetical protein